jgi:hypothetical protein
VKLFSRVAVGKNVDLPKGYPEDILPLYKAESVSAAWEDEGGLYTVSYISKATFKETVDYYTNIMEGTQEKQMYVFEGNTGINY